MERIDCSDIGLVIWRRFTRLNLSVSASTVLLGQPFTRTVTDTPVLAARRLCRDLTLFHWALYGDFRRLARRFSALTASSVVRMRLELIIDDACRKFHKEAVGIRLLCTCAGPGTEWIDSDGTIRRLTTMAVALFKGTAFPGAGPRVLHRSPPLSSGTFFRQSRLVLCIDAVS
ncbi:MAG: DUF1826 domain-containing protein [Proteobacteria bacterium]|nr:DUF1826 domain-containing protein [Pseudomonadota bacterium]